MLNNIIYGSNSSLPDLNGPQQSSWIGPGDIDCELPGPSINPSLNTSIGELVDSSFIIKDPSSSSSSRSYIKWQDCPYTITLAATTGTAISNRCLNKTASILKSNYVYLGYTDTDGNFKNKLKTGLSLNTINDDTSIALTCDTLGCTGYIKGQTDDNTGALIYYSLNTFSNSRTVTFSLNKLPLFKISQTYKAPVPYLYLNITTSYNENNTYALFNDSVADIQQFTTTGLNIYLQIDSQNLSGSTRSYILGFYTNDRYAFNTELTVSQISSNLEHVSGINVGGFGNYYILSMPLAVNVYNGDSRTTTISVGDDIYFYKVLGSTYIYDFKVNFSDTTLTGKYKIKQVTS